MDRHPGVLLFNAPAANAVRRHLQYMADLKYYLENSAISAVHYPPGTIPPMDQPPVYSDYFDDCVNYATPSGTIMPPTVHTMSPAAAPMNVPIPTSASTSLMHPTFPMASSVAPGMPPHGCVNYAAPAGTSAVPVPHITSPIMHSTIHTMSPASAPRKAPIPKAAPTPLMHPTVPMASSVAPGMPPHGWVNYAAPAGTSAVSVPHITSPIMHSTVHTMSPASAPRKAPIPKAAPTPLMHPTVPMASSVTPVMPPYPYIMPPTIHHLNAPPYCFPASTQQFIDNNVRQMLYLSGIDPYNNLEPKRPSVLWPPNDDLDLKAILNEAQKYNDDGPLHLELVRFFTDIIEPRVMAHGINKWFICTASQINVLLCLMSEVRLSIFDQLRWFGYDSLISTEHDDLLEVYQYVKISKRFTGEWKRTTEQTRNEMAVDFAINAASSNEVIAACDAHFEKGPRKRMPYTQMFSKSNPE